VYSLGATLYCLLTGRSPIEGDAGDVLRAVQKGEFPPPRQVNPAIDQALEAVCLKAMALQPDDCYPSPRALAEDVERWMADEPVTAWREPWTRVLVRWLTRHRTGVTAAGAGLLAGVIGLAAVVGVQTQANAKLADSLRRETAANAKLTRAQAAVQARYDLAVEAIETFHTGVSEDFLLKQDQFKDLRDRLLNSASDFYGKLGALLGKESDLASRRALAQASFDVAELTAKVGRKLAALEAHRRVLADREALAREVGSDGETQADVALSLLGLGRILAETGRADEGLAAYEQARAIIQELADDHPAVVRYRDALAQAHHYTGDLHWSVDRYAEAAESHAQARAIWEELAKADPTAVRLRNDQARSDLYSGVNLAKIGRTAEALAAYKRSLAILEKLAADNPAVTQFQRDLANCHGHISNLKSRTGQPAEALAELRAALAIEQKLVNANPAVSAFHRELESSHPGIGSLLLQEGRPMEALAEYRAALAILEKLADDNPTDTRSGRRLAGVHTDIGWILYKSGRLAEAQMAYRQAMPLFQRLAEANPDVPGYRAGLANLLVNIGLVRTEAGDTAGATAVIEQACAACERLVKDHPTVAEYSDGLADTLWALGRAHRRAGRVAAAAADLRRSADLRERLPNLRTEPRYLLACTRALLASLAGQAGSGLPAVEGLAEANRAMEDLRRAVAAGFRNGEWMRTDTDLDPLRSRPDSQLLLMDLTMPDDSYAPSR
jgi:tetratricopeptide (TPR) repeat protein